MNYITGEKIQIQCDHFLCTEKDFNYNFNLKSYKDKCLFIDDLNSSFKNEEKVFIYTHLLQNLNLIIEKLSFLENPFILICHNSDENFTNSYLKLFNVKNLKCIYTQNMNVNHCKVFPLPIGIANSIWKHGNLTIFDKICNENIVKNKNIYFNFNKNTNFIKREKCCRVLKDKLKWVNSLPYENYLSELKNHKFCICPEGNGLDTHRFWECLYLDVIPICLKNSLTTYYGNIFNVVLLNKWEDLEIDKLEYKDIKNKNKYKLNMNKLDLFEDKLDIEKETSQLILDKVYDSFFLKRFEKTSHETLANYSDGTLIPGGNNNDCFYTHINYHTMKKAIELLIEKNRENFTIVETGCSTTHGTKSTLLWDKIVNVFGGKVLSVDLNKTAVDKANLQTSDKTTVTCMNSLDYLSTINEPIDFLYLDSYDVDFLNPDPSAEHHVKEYNCISKNLHKNSIILIDDTPLSPEWLDNGKSNKMYKKFKSSFNPLMTGKGSLLNIEFEKQSFKKILHQYQVLWTM